MKRTVICEYVGGGHPDKVADQISDALLDAFLEKDPNTRAGIEVMVKDNIGLPVFQSAVIPIKKPSFSLLYLTFALQF